MSGDANESKCVDCNFDATAGSNGACLKDFIENIDWVDRFFNDAQLYGTAIHSGASSLRAM
jgi:hypothetical protein